MASFNVDSLAAALLRLPREPRPAVARRGAASSRPALSATNCSRPCSRRRPGASPSDSGSQSPADQLQLSQSSPGASNQLNPAANSPANASSGNALAPPNTQPQGTQTNSDGSTNSSATGSSNSSSSNTSTDTTLSAGKSSTDSKDKSSADSAQQLSRRFRVATSHCNCSGHTTATDSAATTRHEASQRDRAADSNAVR